MGLAYADDRLRVVCDQGRGSVTCCLRQRGRGNFRMDEVVVSKALSEWLGRAAEQLRLVDV